MADCYFKNTLWMIIEIKERSGIRRESETFMFLNGHSNEENSPI